MNKNQTKKFVPTSHGMPHAVRGHRVKGNQTRVEKINAFFKRIPWAEYWEEFLTSRTKQGNMTYATAYGFAKKKAQTDFEFRLLYRAIGPKPLKLTISSGKSPAILQRDCDIPHLGDWQQLRAKAFFYDDSSVDTMRKAVAERLDGLEAGRGAALVVLDLMNEYVMYNRQLDEFAGGRVIEPGVSLHVQKKVVLEFLEIKHKVLHEILTLVSKYLECNGINPSGLNDLGALAMAVGNSAAKSALMGAVTGAAISSQQEPAADPNSRALQMISHAIFDKSTTFKLPLPAAVTHEEQEETVEKK